VTAICGELNVLEVGAGSIAASMAGMVLADGGARVLKVEPPDGDILRAANPSGFLVWNRGKESVVADLRTAEGRDRVLGLASAADVVIEAFAPGRADEWGIGADVLTAANPALVHCSITAFGESGPYAKLKGYDSLVAAKAGLWARGAFGHRDGPIFCPVPWASYGAAMQSVAGIAGALVARETTGRGQRLGATLVNGLEPLEYFVGTIAQLMVKQGQQPTMDSRDTAAATRYGMLMITKDGRIVQTSTLLPHQGRALCEVAGIAHVLDEPRFSRIPMFDNADDAQAWEDLLWEEFRKHDLAYWLPRLEASPDVAFEVAGTSEQGLEHPQIQHNGDVITIDDPAVGPVREVGPIGNFSATPMAPSRSAPALGDFRGPFESPSLAAPSGGGAPAHPFAGVTIVDFGNFYAMPYATAMAAALGARVIKLEDVSGDPYRVAFGPEVASTKTTAGKESLSVDLRTPEGRAIAQQVVAGADVFITSFRAGVADKLGLGYDDLRAKNPSLVYVHAAGYGRDGPYAQRALYAQAAQAVAGSFGRQVGYWADPVRNAGMSVIEMQAIVAPRLFQIIDGDSNGALEALVALALSIYHQRRTGEGQLVVTSMISGNAWAYSDDFCTYAGKPPIPVCDDEYFGTGALDRVYRAAEGTWVCLAVRTDAEFRALVGAVGLPELAEDERFATAEARGANDSDLVAALSGRFADKPADEWESVLSAARVGCVAVNLEGHPNFVCFDPVLRETGLTLTYDHPLFGEMVRTAPHVTFSETPGRVAPPCVRGQHNRSILGDLGYSDEEIARFESDGVVIPPS
jgi:crotonobetainyl-CoA:carnitine CoA-transferase CaiB-like acyl-CoA transferase